MKLVYFNLKGLAESSRILLAINNEKYDDYRYNFSVIDASKHQYNKPEFDNDKNDKKLLKSMNKLPYLEIDGEIICQSKSIERFLARRFNMMGDNEIQISKIDSICESVRDMKDTYQNVRNTQQEKKEEAMNIWFNDTLPERLALLSNLFDEEGQYCINNKLSLADIVLFSLITQFFDNVDGSMNAASKNPRIIKIINSIFDIEEVKKWIKDRPNTMF
jgi:glutathione S-transferase